MTLRYFWGALLDKSLILILFVLEITEKAEAEVPAVTVPAPEQVVQGKCYSYIHGSVITSMSSKETCAHHTSSFMCLLLLCYVNTMHSNFYLCWEEIAQPSTAVLW